MRNLKKIIKIGILVALSALLAGCPGIPKQALDDYVNNFNLAKNTTQDIFLSGKVLAKKANDGSATGNKEFQKREAALDARLKAIDVIGKYNDVLVSLASGTDPASVKGNFEGFLHGLDSFGVESLSSFAGAAGPYGQVIAMAVSAIDDYLKKEKFVEAVEEAERPIQGLIDILKKDADSLNTIQSRELAKQQVPIKNQVDTLRFSFSDAVNVFAKGTKIDKAVTDFNKMNASMQISPKKKPNILHKPAGGSPNAKPEDIGLLKLMVAQMEAQVSGYNQIGQQIEAYRKVISQYKETLEVTKKSFKNLNHAIQNKQRLAPMEIGGTVLKLRQAYLEFQEARTS